MILAHKRVNEAITDRDVVLISLEGENLGAQSREQAFLLANQLGVDLVEVSAGQTPPVVRLMDFGKERYQEEKRTRKQRAKQKSGTVKEVKLSFKISEHDFQTRLSQAKRFLAKGDQIKLAMRLVGRENAFAQQAKEKFSRFAAELDLKADPISQQGPRLMSILHT